MHPRIASRNLQIDIACVPTDAVAEVPGDRQKLASLVSNLNDNALRRAPDGTAAEVSFERANDSVPFSVRE